MCHHLDIFFKKKNYFSSNFGFSLKTVRGIMSLLSTGVDVVAAAEPQLEDVVIAGVA